MIELLTRQVRQQYDNLALASEPERCRDRCRGRILDIEDDARRQQPHRFALLLRRSNGSMGRHKGAAQHGNEQKFAQALHGFGSFAEPVH